MSEKISLDSSEVLVLICSAENLKTYRSWMLY